MNYLDMDKNMKDLHESLNHILFDCLYNAQTEKEKVFFYNEYKRIKKLYDKEMDELADWLRYDAN